MPSNPFRLVVDKLYESFNRVPRPPGWSPCRQPEPARRILNALACPDQSHPVVLVTGRKDLIRTGWFASPTRALRTTGAATRQSGHFAPIACSRLSAVAGHPLLAGGGVA
jgi:hypothetical protein